MKLANPFELARQNQARLQQDQQDGTPLESNSAVCNEIAGICPKCSRNMDTAMIGPVSNPEPVFWCGDCKVSTPKPRT